MNFSLYFSKYQRFKENNIIQQNPSIRYCFNRNCQTILFGSSSSPHLICSNCGHEQCFNCCVDWHKNKNCEEYEEELKELSIKQQIQREKNRIEEEKQFQLYLHENKSKYRQCLQCMNIIELVSGCYKLTCRCGNRFCWKCGSPEARCDCTSRIHVFYPLHSVLTNWNGRGVGR